MKHDVHRHDPSELQPFADLADHCDLHGWVLGLGHSKTGLTMEVRDSGELLAKATSSLAPARAIPDMSLRVSMALEKQRRAKG